jgi:predicted regulator of Ras-like GTPase activity (Roadblock/LC7/MglB family)
MSFTRALRSIVDEAGGGIGAALMGSDGIAIDQVEASSPAASLGDDTALGDEIAALDAETFLVVVLAPDGNLGKARFLMRRHLADLRAHL